MHEPQLTIKRFLKLLVPVLIGLAIAIRGHF